jgi:hypothetical protein
MNTKNIITLLAIAVILLSSCTKDQNIKPVRDTVIGLWSTPGMTWSIDRTDGTGWNAHFTEIQRPDGKYLHVLMPIVPIDETYKIATLNDRCMVLIDSHGVSIAFDRIK